MKPRLLDLFCGEGGCAEGYRRAGFDDITGVDLYPMARYPFEFFQWDALDFLDRHGHEFDFIHASPPCQAHSGMNNIHKKEYRDFIAETRSLLKIVGLPYVIENVIGAPLHNYILIQGNMFSDLRVKRERLFETSFNLKHLAIPQESLGIPAAGRGASATSGFVTVVGTGGLGGGLDWIFHSERYDYNNPLEYSDVSDAMIRMARNYLKSNSLLLSDGE